MNFLYHKLYTVDNFDISIMVLIKIIIPVLVSLYLGKLFVGLLRNRLSKIWEHFGKSRYIIEIFLRLFLFVSGVTIGFKIAGIDKSVFYYFNTLIFQPFFHIGASPISIMSITLLLLVISVSIFLSKYLIKLLQKDVYPNTTLESGIQNIIDTVVKYLIITVGVIIGLQVNGIDLSVFATISAGLMVGIGFGLQNIASNFISGIVILLERPIKAGDYVQVGDICGVIKHINGRSTLITTRENISMIVPNSKFISENVVNWSHNDARVLIKIPIGISYSSDPRHAEKVLLEIAEKHELVLSNPDPGVLLEEFGSSSVNLVLEVWIEKVRKRFEIISEINFDIAEKFKEEGITIPFPQLDIHKKN